MRINDIFESISGEAGGFFQGTWMTGVRLQGCNLRCKWCDTLKGQDENTPTSILSVQEVLEEIEERGNNHILITGGEPLQQKNEVIDLIRLLLYNSYQVQVETNGSIELPSVHSNGKGNLYWVIDYKCPSSKMTLNMLPLHDFANTIIKTKYAEGNIFVSVKFVVADEEDCQLALDTMIYLKEKHCNVPFIISPIDAQGDMIKDIVDKIKEEYPALLDFIIFSVQLHKIFKLP